MAPTLKPEKSEKNYELLAIFAGSLKESVFKKELSKWEKEIQTLGKIEYKAIWEDRPLAYKIKKEIMGTYFICHFSADPTKILEFENTLRLDSSIIRHLIYATPKNYKWREYETIDLEHDPHKIVDESADVPVEKKIEKNVSKKTSKPTSNIDKKLDNILDKL